MKRGREGRKQIALFYRRLLRDDANHRCESLDGEVPFENYIKIDNSHLAPEAAAEKIKEAFGL